MSSTNIFLLVFFVFLLCVKSRLYSFSGTIWSGGWDTIRSAVFTSDGEIAMCGEVEMSGWGSTSISFFVVLLKRDGNVKWIKMFDEGDFGECISIIETEEKRLLIIAISRFDGLADGIIMQMSFEGEVTTKRKLQIVEDLGTVFGGSALSRDEKIYICGNLFNTSTLKTDGILVKLGENGELTSVSGVGGLEIGDEMFKDVIVIEDGFIVVGQSSSPNYNESSYSYYPLIIKLGSNGEIDWYKILILENLVSQGNFVGVFPSSNGQSFYAVGYFFLSENVYTEQGSANGLIFKFSLEGDVLWSSKVNETIFFTGFELSSNHGVNEDSVLVVLGTFLYYEPGFHSRDFQLVLNSTNGEFISSKVHRNRTEEEESDDTSAVEKIRMVERIDDNRYFILGSYGKRGLISVLEVNATFEKKGNGSIMDFPVVGCVDESTWIDVQSSGDTGPLVQFIEEGIDYAVWNESVLFSYAVEDFMENPQQPQFLYGEFFVYSKFDVKCYTCEQHYFDEQIEAPTTDEEESIIRKRCGITTCDGFLSNQTGKDVCEGRRECVGYNECSEDTIEYFSKVVRSSEKSFLFRHASPTSDGGVIATGREYTLDEKSDVVVSKLTPNGDFEWVRKFECISGECDSETMSGGTTVRERNDENGYIVGGYVGIGDVEHETAFAMGLKKNGDLEWAVTFWFQSVYKSNYESAVVSPLDGTVYLVGRYFYQDAGADSNQGGLVSRITPDNARSIRTRTLQLGNGQVVKDNIQTLDYYVTLRKKRNPEDDDEQVIRFVFGGCSKGVHGNIGKYQFLIGSFDDNLNSIWTKVIHGESDEEFRTIKELKVTRDNKYIIGCGHSRVGVEKYNHGIFLKMTVEGDLVWLKRLSNHSNHFEFICNGVVELSPSGDEQQQQQLSSFLFTGSSTDASLNVHTFLSKISSDGEMIWFRLNEFITNEMNEGGDYYSKLIVSLEADHNRYSGTRGGSIITSGYLRRISSGFTFWGHVQKMNYEGVNCEYLEGRDDALHHGHFNFSNHNVVVVNVSETFLDNPDIVIGYNQIDLDVVDLENTDLLVNVTCWSCHGYENDPKVSMKILGNETYSCSGKGICKENGKCECQVEYLGDECDVPGYCFNISHNDTEKVCSGHGHCVNLDVCECRFGYYGVQCEDTYCYGIEQKNDNSYIFPLSRINSTDQNLTCSGHGFCNKSTGTCECDDDGMNYWGIGCHLWKCNGTLNYQINDTNPNYKEMACSQHGLCIDHNECDCEDDYEYSSLCDDWKCFDVFKNDTSAVCWGHGNCIESDNCSCQTNYFGSQCEIWSCFDSCSGHGDCVSHDNCSCFSDAYTGEWCEWWYCNRIRVDIVDDVCVGHGSCIDTDKCFCQTGYGSAYSGGPCDIWFCGEFIRTDNKSVCNSRGKCVSSHSCVCTGGYEGSLCETWSCGFEKESPLTCRGNGECIGPGLCDCKGGFTGKNCNVNLLYFTVMIPIILLFLCFVGCFLCCIFCVILSLSFLLFVVFVSSSFGFCVVVTKQRSGIQRFGKLRNFDLLLKEQELEDDDSVAKLHINKSLYQISFDEIKIDCVLGEGGSQSIVFKAFWKNNVVVFKCFKTRHVCSDQISYGEFEKEVEILASVSHPNIIRFFGATMNPPRVGIVMEHCENGDLDEFLASFKRKYEMTLPINEKLRILNEICMACDYLHRRSIIHRDLKLENVLIDFHFTSKLMDFGLSKIVERSSAHKTSKIGTSLYIAPEVITGDGTYNEKCDVFSYGILLWILVTENKYPYGKNKRNMEIKVANNPDFRPPLDELRKCLKSFDGKTTLGWIEDVVVTCWGHEPRNRPSFPELSKMFEENNVTRSIISNEKREKGKARIIIDRDDQVKDEKDMEENNDAGKDEPSVVNERLIKELRMICEDSGKYDFDEIMKRVVDGN